MDYERSFEDAQRETCICSRFLTMPSYVDTWGHGSRPVFHLLENRRLSRMGQASSSGFSTAQLRYDNQSWSTCGRPPSDEHGVRSSKRNAPLRFLRHQARFCWSHAPSVPSRWISMVYRPCRRGPYANPIHIDALLTRQA